MRKFNLIKKYLFTSPLLSLLTTRPISGTSISLNIQQPNGGPTLPTVVSPYFLRAYFKNIWTKLKYVLVPRFEIHDNP